MLGLASTLFASGLVTALSPRVIMKFGGSSVRDAERIQEVCKLVVNQMEEEGVRPHLVCSAMGKTTNNLLAAAERAINEQVVDLSAVRDLHADTAVKLGLVDSSEYADVLRLLDECERHRRRDVRRPEVGHVDLELLRAGLGIGLGLGLG